MQVSETLILLSTSTKVEYATSGQNSRVAVAREGRGARNVGLDPVVALYV